MKTWFEITILSTPGQHPARVQIDNPQRFSMVGPHNYLPRNVNVVPEVSRKDSKDDRALVVSENSKRLVLRLDCSQPGRDNGNPLIWEIPATHVAENNPNGEWYDLIIEEYDNGMIKAKRVRNNAFKLEQK